MTLRLGLVLSLMVIFGCESDRNNRLSLEVSRRAQVVDEFTEVSISGGTFVTIEQTVSATPTPPVLRFISRAESLQPRINIKTNDCAPRVFQFSIRNIDTSRTTCQYSSLRQDEKAIEQAGRQLLAPLGTTIQSGEPARGTYVVRPTACALENPRGGELQLSACLDWATGRTEIRPGYISYEACFTNQARAACLEQTLGGEAAVSSSTLEVEFILSASTDENLVVAAIANLEPDESIIASMAEDFAAQNVDFVMVVGDLTKAGSVSQAESISDLLDQHLSMPWFATLGDQDVDGNLGVEYLGLFGSASLAFDVDGVRFVLLDSANGGLKETDELLDLWLSDLTLSGTNKGSLQHLVFTHYPPFSDAGGSRPQFEHTFEAGGLVARLASIGAMGLVVGQRKSAALERIGSVNVYHIGGIKDNDSVSWSKFTIDPSCIALCNANLAACDCMVYERVR